MDDRELLPFRDRSWSTLSHHVASAELAFHGWSKCAEGDWAYVYQSPSGRLAARVSPFERGYEYFVALCVRCAGNRYLPRIDLATDLEGGGHLTILEFLETPDSPAVQTFLHHWEHPDGGDDDLGALRHEVDAIDVQGRQTLPGWVGIDIGERHVLLSSDGNLKVLDLFGVDWSFLQELLADPALFAASAPASTWRYISDIPDLQHDHPSDYLPQIRAALQAAKTTAATQDDSSPRFGLSDPAR